MTRNGGGRGSNIKKEIKQKQKDLKNKNVFSYFPLDDNDTGSKSSWRGDRVEDRTVRPKRDMGLGVIDWSEGNDFILSTVDGG